MSPRNCSSHGPRMKPAALLAATLLTTALLPALLAAPLLSALLTVGACGGSLAPAALLA